MKTNTLISGLAIAALSHAYSGALAFLFLAALVVLSGSLRTASRLRAPVIDHANVV